MAVATIVGPVGPRWPAGIAQPGRQGTADVSATRGASPTDSQPTGRPNLLVADGSFELGQPDWCRWRGTSDDLSTGLTLDAAQADRGRASARCLIEPEQEVDRIRIPLPVVGYRPGRHYCVSLALRASSAQVLTVTLSGAVRVEPRRWRVERRWQRFDQAYTLSPARSDAPPELVISTVKAPEPWVLWIDSLKVEAGSSSTAYRPADVPLIGVSFDRRSGLFFEGHPVDIVVGARCPRGKCAGAELRWALFPGVKGPRRGSVPIGEAIGRHVPIHRGSLPPGRYRLDLELVGASGKALARRTEPFGVVRDLSDLANQGLRLIVPSRGPRSDAMARRLGLSIGDTTTTSVSTAWRITSRPATEPRALRHSRSLPSPARRLAVATRIRDLTAARAAGARTVYWPAAWNELLDVNGRWGPVAVAVNTWTHLLADTTHLREIRLNGGTVTLDVFSGTARHLAMVSTGGARTLAVGGDGSHTVLQAPLSPADVTVMDVYGRPLPMAGGENRFVVDLRAGPVYLVAGPNVTRGRFALQLEDARIVRPTSTSRH